MNSILPTQRPQCRLKVRSYVIFVELVELVSTTQPSDTTARQAAQEENTQLGHKSHTPFLSVP